MIGNVVDSDEVVDEKPAKQVPRLCNEIQLFDLCDLEKCSSKQGAFCTNPELLGRFEAIAEEEERSAEGFGADELDDGMEHDDDGYDDEFDDEGYEEDE